jgi:hypothetical protein
MFESALNAVKLQLHAEDKVSYEWFDDYVTSFYDKSGVGRRGPPIGDEDDEWLKLVEDLINHEAVTVEKKFEAPSSQSVTMHFSHMVDPIAIAVMLISARENVLKGIKFIRVSNHSNMRRLSSIYRVVHILYIFMISQVINFIFCFP